MGSSLRKLRRGLPPPVKPSLPLVVKLASERIAAHIKKKLGPPNEVTGTFSAIDGRGIEHMYYVVEGRGRAPRVFGPGGVTVTIGGHPVQVEALSALALDSEVARG